MTKPAIPHTRRTVAMLSMLATGWLPWGVRWDEPDGFANLPWCQNRDSDRAPGAWIMCCGHSMDELEARRFVKAGLLKDGPRDHFGSPTLVITDAGKDWVAAFFDGSDEPDRGEHGLPKVTA